MKSTRVLSTTLRRKMSIVTSISRRRKALSLLLAALVMLTPSLFRSARAQTGTPPVIFTSPNAQDFGGFGFSVAVSGSTLVLGAPNETANGLTGAGHAYVFGLSGGSPIVLTSPNAQTDGHFGYSVAVSGTSVVVGARDEAANTLTYAGNAYIFSTSGGSPITLTSPNQYIEGQFGRSVAISGTSVVVGAPQEPTLPGIRPLLGHAYIFNTVGTRIATLSSTHPQEFGEFGYSVAISGTRVVVGAPNEGGNVTQPGFGGPGNAYVFSTTGGIIGALASPHAQFNGFFGWSVSTDDTDVVIGAPGETANGLTGAGHAYIISTANGYFSLTASLTSPNAETNGAFGNSVAVSSSNVAVGAVDETVNGYTYAGRTYILNAAGTLTATLTSPNAQAKGYFGRSVAVSGTSVAVGAWGETANRVTGAGDAYMYVSFDFTISNSGPILAGLNQPGSDQISVDMFGVSSQTVHLSCAPLLGVICQFFPMSDTQSFTSNLTVRLTSGAPTSSFILTVIGTSDGIAHTTQVPVIISHFNSPCDNSAVTNGSVIINIFNCIPLPNLFAQIILPPGTSFGPTVIGTAGAIGPNNFVLITGETVTGKTITISRNSPANSVCIIDSPNLQTLNLELLEGILPACDVTNLQAMIAGSIVSEILLYCDGAIQHFPRNPQESFPTGTPPSRTYTCTPTTYNRRPAFVITGLAYSFVMTMTVTTSVSSFFTDSDLNPLPADSLGNPKADVVLPGGRVRSTNPGQILAWANVTNTGSVPLESLTLKETLPIDWVVSPTFTPAVGSVGIFFILPNATRLDITSQAGITITTGNPETLTLSIANITSAGAHTPLLPGEGILVSVKLDYGLKGTLQPATSYPRDYASTVIMTAWTGAQLDGLSSNGQTSAAFKAYPKLVT